MYLLHSYDALTSLLHGVNAAKRPMLERSKCIVHLLHFTFCTYFTLHSSFRSTYFTVARANYSLHSRLISRSNSGGGINLSNIISLQLTLHVYTSFVAIALKRMPGQHPIVIASPGYLWCYGPGRCICRWGYYVISYPVRFVPRSSRTLTGHFMPKSSRTLHFSYPHWSSRTYIRNPK